MRFTSRLLIVLMVSALLVGPFRFVASTAQAQSLPISTDKLIPNGLISDENREAVEKALKKGVATCAIMAVVLELVGMIPGIKVPVDRRGNDIKENLINCIVYQVVNALIEDMLRNLTAWVQGGFKGNPVFVTNFERNLRRSLDAIAGEYIQANIPFICSPFRAQIHLQLITVYKDSRGDYYNPSCTLSGSLENIERFADGDFSAGGWNMWFDTFSNPYNNPYGAYIESLNELELRLDAATQEVALDINLGNGFLSRKLQTCYAYSSDNRVTPPQEFTVRNGETTLEARERLGITSQIVECDPPRVVTPGAFIESQIEKKFGLPDDRLTMADELNELINAVILFLVNKIFEEEEGFFNEDLFDAEPIDFVDPTIGTEGGGDDSTPGDTEQPGPPGQSMCFENRGTFLTPTEGGTVSTGFRFNLPHNVSYDRIELEVDVTNNGWLPDREGWPAMIFWLGRPDNKNMFGYSRVNAPGNRTFLLAHGIGVSHAFKTRVRTKIDFPEGATYRFRYLYDVEGQLVRLQAIDVATGDVVRALTSTPTVPGINVGNEVFNLGFGYTEAEANPKERPMYGWEYSNMKTSFISGSDAPDDCTAASPTSGTNDRPSDPPDPDDREL